MAWLRPLVGIVVVGLTSLGIGYPIWWNHRSQATGATLIAAGKAQLNQASSSCPDIASVAAAPLENQPGVLEIPSIGLVAPVLQGLSDAVLNVAAGHQPSTPWPGAPGESMVLAHDVSYFANLGRVRSGASVIWLTRCMKAEFRIDGASVQAPGDLVNAPSNQSGLALVTCYPTNALFWTTQRYVVTAHLVSEQVASQNVLYPKGTGLPAMSVNAPNTLVSEGLGLDQNSLELGTLSINGSPAANFAQGPGPLAVEREALEVFFGAKKSVEQHQPSWWADLSLPGLAFPRSWPSFGAVNVAITVKGDTPSAVSIASPQASATVVLHDNVWQLAALGG